MSSGGGCWCADFWARGGEAGAGPGRGDAPDCSIPELGLEQRAGMTAVPTCKRASLGAGICEWGTKGSSCQGSGERSEYEAGKAKLEEEKLLQEKA